MDVRGIGVDIVEVERIARALERWGDAFVFRLFTPGEDVRARHPRLRSQRLAARFAAKEAVMKALGLGWRTMAWHEIEIVHDPLGRPAVRLRGGAARAAQQQGVAAVHVTLSHTRALALAGAVALGAPSA
ncbi:MAG: holo-ACP synthase [Armatimonadota bacterium]|nr:holo-ACP synthase [Armatimonadota bacterium]MDR7451981.1 holo-ACP synthase [Armatimonadota bacterium]MDR7468374.1 holo-ACP synthase [Armatimonadota bacterium]MDR7494275.1 holo-ACP synthase [Armatimonadota bacterium]MDR7500056.1 holo-ACP synthase [Armatimonadota bacterium]